MHFEHRVTQKRLYYYVDGKMYLDLVLKLNPFTVCMTGFVSLCQKMRHSDCSFDHFTNATSEQEQLTVN